MCFLRETTDKIKNVFRSGNYIIQYRRVTINIENHFGNIFVYLYKSVHIFVLCSLIMGGDFIGLNKRRKKWKQE